LVSRNVLLGPVGDGAILDGVLRSLDVDGPVALVTAGWAEAERNDAELDRALGGGTRNLGLYGRRLDILDRDGEYAAAERQLHAVIGELREAYLVQLRHALLGVEAVRQHVAKARRRTAAQLDDAIETVRALDDRHAARMAEAYGEFYTAFPPHDRTVIAEHRESIAATVSECAAIAIAGGHVGVLNDCLHLANIGAVLGDRPLLAWSSGAMAAAERVMVVDDGDLAARPDEVLAEGIGVVHGVVPLPDAVHRMRVDDRDHLALLARRVAPRVCVLLDSGDVLPCDGVGVPDFQLARVVAPDGTVIATSEAA
jgi:hypothetical protein